MLRPIYWTLLLFAAGTGCAAAPQRPTEASCAALEGESMRAMTDEQLARKILDVTGAGAVGVQAGSAMLENLKKLPNLPPGFLEKFRENMKTSELNDLIVPIYLKHYSRETMVAMLQFYESPAGKVLTGSLPDVMSESMEAGKEWGTRLAKKTLEDLGVTR